MSKSGLADSPFFTKPVTVQVDPPVDSPPMAAEKMKSVSPHPVRVSPQPAKPKTKHIREKKEKKQATVIPSHNDTVVSRTPEEILEQVRKACRELGKEAATHRFTVAEKRHIAEIVYTYKTQGIKTTENEITRIAVNYLIEDYKTNGENSLLDRVLKALNE